MSGAPVVGEREARGAWTVLSEPGDPVAGELLSWVGAARTLAWVRSVGLGRPDWSLLEPDAPGQTPGPASTVGASLGLDGASGSSLSPSARTRLVKRARAWVRRLDVAGPALDAAARAGLSLVVPGDPGWPAGLDDLGACAPHALWVRGDLGGRAAGAVALVGARACTTYGQQVAADLADGLAARGIVVVSGGAYGIDAAAHRGALAAGVTWAVLAGGLDRIYPAGHATLFAQVVEQGGAVLGEAPPGAVPARHRFLQRNRLIAALSAGTVVVEAAWRSGALSTAHHAAALLRPVGAVPGPVTSVVSAGCHRLLREGAAVCVTDAAEVAELVGPVGTAAGADPADLTPLDGLDVDARAVHDALSVRTPASTAQLVVRTGLGAASVRAGLGRLDLAGLVLRDGEGWRAVAVRRTGSGDLGRCPTSVESIGG